MTGVPGGTGMTGVPRDITPPGSAGHAAAAAGPAGGIGPAGGPRIPIRNRWLLYLYASELYGALSDEELVATEANPDDIDELVARILAAEAGHRLRTAPTPGYRPRAEDLTRVRGRIDHLRTHSHRLLTRGLVACRFEELTVDTPRNRLVLRALTVMASACADPATADRCRSLAATLQREGVTPPRSTADALREARHDRFGRHDLHDRRMVAAARLALTVLLPTHEAGDHALRRTVEDGESLEELFEAAVAGFLRLRARRSGFVVEETTTDWSVDGGIAMLAPLLPDLGKSLLVTSGRRRMVVLPVFGSLLAEETDATRPTLRRELLLDMLARLQAHTPAGAPPAEGVFVAPAVDGVTDMPAIVNGFPLRLLTIDLAGPTAEIRHRLASVPRFHTEPWETAGVAHTRRDP